MVSRDLAPLISSSQPKLKSSGFKAVLCIKQRHPSLSLLDYKRLSRSGEVVFLMQFLKTSLQDAMLIKAERIYDNRGYFATVFSVPDYEAHGIPTRILQTSTSFNNVRGTVRGMHLQLPPYAETKLVRAVAGAIYDVIVDLRPDSPTFKKWEAFELSADNMNVLYIPEGFAHGYQTLTDNAEVFYQLSQTYAPGHARGIRFDDPSIDIKWPLDVAVISERDAKLPTLEQTPQAELDQLRLALSR